VRGLGVRTRGARSVGCAGLGVGTWGARSVGAVGYSGDGYIGLYE
jgi:hypothetical protein